MVGGALETRGECSIKEKVIVSRDYHFILELAEMKEEVGGSRVAIEGEHQEFSRESEHGDFPRQW